MVLAIAIAIAIAPAPALARKLFVRQLELQPGCASLSPRALLTLIAEQMPRDVLARRGLEYEDVSAYRDMSSFGEERFEVRREENVERRLQQLDMQYAVDLDLGCTSGHGGTAYLLTGRITDLDRMDEALACPDDQASEVDGRRVCHVAADTYDGNGVTHVDLEDLRDLVPALRDLLSRLLQVPQISFASPLVRVDTWGTVELPFLMRLNDGSEPGFTGHRIEGRAYRLDQDVVEIPHDLEDEICDEPEEHWNQISCNAGYAGPGCDSADSVRFAARSLVHDQVAADLRALQAPRGGDRIAFQVGEREGTFLVRGVARATEAGGELTSPPVYRCVRVRQRPLQIGFAARLGVPSDITHLSTPRTESEYPTAGLVAPSVGIDVDFPLFLYGFRSIWFSGMWFVPVLGFTQNSGTYPCPSRAPGNCEVDLSIWPREIHFTTSAAIEGRGQLRADVVRLGPVALRITADAGFGLEILGSSPSYMADGAYGLFVTGALLELVLHLPGPADGFGSQIRLGGGWQVRQRFPSANRIQPGFVMAAGVPDTIDTWYVLLGGDLGLPM